MRFIVFSVCFIGIIFFSSTLHENYQGIVSNILSIAFVFGGTLVATLISFPVEKIRKIRPIVKKSFGCRDFDYARNTMQIIAATRDYKRLGFKALEDAAHVPSPEPGPIHNRAHEDRPWCGTGD